MVSIESNVSYPRRWNEAKNSLDHSETGSQYRHECDLLAGDVPSRLLLERSLYLSRLETELTRCLVGHEHRDLIDELLEVLRFCLLISEDRQLVLNKRMPDNSQRGEFLDALDHSSPRIPAIITLTGS